MDLPDPKRATYFELVPALAAKDSCLGCVFFSRSGVSCNHPNLSGPELPCLEKVAGSQRVMVFIEKTPEARAAYTALLLEHGRNPRS